MRVLIYTQTVDEQDPILGFFHHWLKEFARHCARVTVICLKEGRHSLPQNVTIYSLGKEKGHSKFGYIVRFYELLWKTRGTYDAVFVHMNAIYAVLGGLFWRLSRIPVGLWYSHKHTPVVLRVAERFINHLFTQTAESTSIKTDKKRIMGHGIDVDLFAPSPSFTTGHTRLIAVGRVTRVKNLDALIEAFSRLSNTDAEIDIVGGPITPEDATYQKTLQERIRALNIQDRVHFLGTKSQTELRPLLASAILMVNLTKTDSFDKTLLEAWSMELPVLASNTSAARTLDELDIPSCFNTSATDIQKIANDLEQCLLLLQNPDEKEHIGKAVRQYVSENHNLHNLIPRILNTLKTN